MELTTQQLYAVFAMLSVSAIAGLIFYCVGLRTGRDAGYKLGRESAAIHWRKLLKAKQESNNELREHLNNRSSELLTARENLITEAESHRHQLANLRGHMHEQENDREGIIRDLLEELQHETANRLTNDDWLNLKLAAKQLSSAAHQHARSGSAKTNQAAQAQACITALAERVKVILDQPPRLCEMAEHGITDTALIEWLNSNATHCYPFPFGFQLEFGIDNLILPAPTNDPEQREHLRDLLVAVVQQQQHDTQTAVRVISNFCEQEAERAA